MDSDMVDTAPNAALTKAQLSAIVFQQIDNLSKTDVKDVVDTFFELIASNLIVGRDVKISGFGSFQIRSKAPRPGRNPRTGAAIKIKAAKIPKFRPGKALKDALS